MDVVVIYIMYYTLYNVKKGKKKVVVVRTIKNPNLLLSSFFRDY